MLSALVFAAALQATPAACDYDRDAMLALAPAAFDQDLSGGWRALAEKPGCEAAAADLLAEWREAHRAELKIGDLHINYWHEGQLRAGLGQNQKAIRLLMAGVNPQVDGDGFQDYALGTVAFLNGDRAGLVAARERLASLPRPEGFQRSADAFREKYGFEVKWPMNLDVLDGLIACFGKPYDEAYGDCRPD